MYKEEYYDYSGNEGKWIKDELKKRGFHHVTISNFPADFFRMSKSQLEKLFEKASDSFISEMYDVPIQQIQNRRSDFDIKQLGCTINRMWREEELAQTIKEILRIVSNEYNNGNIPHTNSTPLNSEKEFLYMKATGIVRRIDDLGRVVIPKEIRRTMRIREGDPLEIFTNKEGEVIFKKYSPIGEMTAFSSDYASALAEATRLAVVICDRDHCVAVGGAPKRELLEKTVTPELEKIAEARQMYLKDEKSPVYALEGAERQICVAAPIISAGDITGSVVLLENDGYDTITDIDIKLAEVAARFLGSRIE